jgi:hypothetical protein
MTTNRTAKPYPAELRERAVQLVREQNVEHLSLAAAIRSVAAKIGCSAERCGCGCGRPSVMAAGWAARTPTIVSG